VGIGSPLIGHQVLARGRCRVVTTIDVGGRSIHARRRGRGLPGQAPKTSTVAGLAVPDAVTIAMGEITDDMREGLLALAVGAGFQ